jgi:predicted Na+-dependent transporter
MRKALLSSTVAVCFGLMLATGWLLATPVPAHAQMAICTARCGGGKSVSCAGSSCVATDYDGCASDTTHGWVSCP